MKFRSETGVVAVTMILWVAVFSLAILTTAAILMSNDLRGSATQVAGVNTFAAAEAGLNDALYKLSQDPSQGGGSPTYTMTVGNIGVEITISPAGLVSPKVVDARAVDPATNVVRTVHVSTHLSSFGGFEGAILAGNGGFRMNNADVTGNVCANGNVEGTNPNNDIQGNVYVGGAHFVDGVNVSGFLRADDIRDSDVEGTATYRVIDNQSRVGPTNSQCPNASCIQTNDLPELCQYPPIPAYYYDKNDPDERSWYHEGLAGCPANDIAQCPTDITLGNGENRTLGPIVINGDLFLDENSTLILTGTIWVTGRIEFDSNAIIKLDGATYGANSGAIVAEGLVDLKNNGAVTGSDPAFDPDDKSYLVVASLSNGMGSPHAIEPAQNNTTALYFAPNGSIHLDENVELSNATAQLIVMDNSSTARYDDKLNDLLLLSGTSGGQGVFVRPTAGSWQEK